MIQLILAATLSASCPEGDERCEQTRALRNDHVDEALLAFAKGEYEDAAQQFEQAFEVAHLSVDLFNVARVHDAAGNYGLARKYYAWFMSRRDIDEEQRARAADRLRRLPKTSEPSKAQTPPPRVNETPPPAALAVAPGPDEPSVHWATITGATLLPVGVATLVGGLSLHFAARENLDDARRDAPNPDDLSTAPQYGLSRRQSAASTALLATGGVLSAAGAVFLGTGIDIQRRSETRPVSARVGPGSVELTVEF